MSFVGKWFGFGRNPHYDDGVRAYERGDDEAAIECFKVCLASEPDAASRERAKNYLAGSLGRAAAASLASGAASDAVTRLREATALRPGFADLRRQLALACLATGDLDGARSELDAALDLNPRYGHAWATLAGLWMREGRTQEALDAAAKAVKFDPRLPGAVLEQVRSMAPSAAAQALLGWEPDRSARVEDRVSQADAHMKKMKWAQAEQIYREAVAVQPRYADLRLKHGQSLLELGELSDAANEFREALALNEGLAEAHALLGIALRRQGDEPGSKECFRRAVALDPDHPIASAELVRMRG